MTSRAAALTVAFDKGRILAYEGTTSQVVGTHQVGRFRTTMPAIGSLAHYANSSHYGQAHVDNISVAYGRPSR